MVCEREVRIVKDPEVLPTSEFLINTKIDLMLSLSQRTPLWDGVKDRRK